MNDPARQITKVVTRLSPHLEPGEQVRAVAPAVLKDASIWLLLALIAVCLGHWHPPKTFFGLHATEVMQATFSVAEFCIDIYVLRGLLFKWYAVVVTDSRVLFAKRNAFGRLRGTVEAFPRSAVHMDAAKRGMFGERFDLSHDEHVENYFAFEFSASELDDLRSALGGSERELPA